MSPRIVLVAIDFSQASHAALAWAIEHVHGGEQIHLIHVVEDLPGFPAAKVRADADAKRISETALAELAKLTAGRPAALPPVVQHVRRGHPVRTILACARDVGAELLVVGSHGHTGLERVLVGSVAERVVRLADCPVVVVKDLKRAP